MAVAGGGSVGECGRLSRPTQLTVGRVIIIQLSLLTYFTYFLVLVLHFPTVGMNNWTDKYCAHAAKQQYKAQQMVNTVENHINLDCAWSKVCLVIGEFIALLSLWSRDARV